MDVPKDLSEFPQVMELGGATGGDRVFPVNKVNTISALTSCISAEFAYTKPEVNVTVDVRKKSTRSLRKKV